MRAIPVTSASLFAFLVIAAPMSVGCRDLGMEGARPNQLDAVYSPNTGRLEELRYDTDGDGDVDIRTFMDGNRALRSEVDTDGNGIVDRWEYYGPDGKVEKVGTSSANDGVEDTWTFQAANGDVLRIERSAARDGRVSRREAFLEGQLVSAEEDTNGDGEVDRWETYDHARLSTLAFDSSRSHGLPDQRLVYDADGQLARIEDDPDGDGVFTPRPIAEGDQPAHR
jgi:hypothetical protein